MRMIVTRRNAMSLLGWSAFGLAMPGTGFGHTRGQHPGSSCAITPEMTGGPFYFDPKLVRSDVPEGRPGVAVIYRLQIVDGSCKPLAGARVDIWHCDAAGLYSNYPGQGDDRRHPVSTRGETFLRGTQIADAGGTAAFRSIFPGWYPG